MNEKMDTGTIRRWRGKVWQLGVGLIVGFGGGLTGGSADELGSPPVVMMSPYEVSAASVEFEGWKKLISPNFVVYTDAAATEVRPMMERLEMIFMATQVTIGRRPLTHAPITLILPSSRSDWKKIRSKGQVQWKVGATSFHQLAYFVVLEYDWQDDGVSLVYTITTNLNLRLLGMESAFAIGRGLSYFFETAEMHEGALNIGQANSRVGQLKYDRWFEWEKFFSINKKSPEYLRDSDLLHRFNAQAAIFVHYLLMQEDPKMKAGLWEWNMLLLAGKDPTEALFESVFGMGWDTLQETMEHYLSKGSFTTRLYRFPPELMKFVVTELEVKTQEMRELFVLTQIHNQRIDDSKLALDSLLDKGLKTADLRSMLVGACLSWDRKDAALNVLREMIAEGGQYPEVYGKAAELILEASPPGHFPPTEVLAEAKALARTALEGESLMAEVIEGLALLIALEPEMTAAKVGEIKQLCRRLAGNGPTDGALAALAFASWRAGDTARAQRVCELLRDSQFTGRSTLMFTTLVAEAMEAGKSPAEMLASLAQKKN